MRFLFVLAAVAALAVGSWSLYQKWRPVDQADKWRIAPIERKDLVVTVRATGTVEPEELIDVGAQVVGRINEFGPDPRGEQDPAFKGKHIDYNTPIEEGTVLAVIDDAVYRAQRDQAQATLNHAKADVDQLEARREQAAAEWERAQRLRSVALPSASPTGSAASRNAVPIQGISDADYVMAKSNFHAAKANVEVGKAAVAQAQSALELANTNLAYTVIRSPVKGTIIDRRVNIGQTVVSSLNAPSLFLIGTDLRRMQVWASVNEADIGQLKVGTPVQFSVDAFPDDSFRGSVEQIRLNASMTQNVVIYTVVIATDNSNLKLLPYLTADVKFEVQRRNDVLAVPNQALRFEPSADVAGTSPPGAEPDRGAKDKPANQGAIWIDQDGGLRALSVTVGVSDGADTEVSGPGVEEGLRVVVGENRPGADDSGPVNNPFAPQFRRGKARSAPRSSAASG